MSMHLDYRYLKFTMTYSLLLTVASNDILCVNHSECDTRLSCSFKVYLLLESTTIARGCLLLWLNITRLFDPLVVISAMMP